MGAKAIFHEKKWRVRLNWKGDIHIITDLRNIVRNPEYSDQQVAEIVAEIINTQILVGNFRLDTFFPRLRRKYLFKEAYWAWLDSKPRAPSTLVNIKYKYQHFKPIWDRDLRELAHADFFWIRAKHGDTQKAKSIRQMGQALMNWAWKTGMIDRPIFLPSIIPPKGKTPYLSFDARMAIYEAMEPPYQAPTLLGIQMGLRIGEICALQWGDIDWEGEGINVCHTMSAYQLRDTRKGGDEVWLPMTEKVKEMLLRLRTERPVIAGYIFTHLSGKQIWTQQLSAAFKGSCRICGMPFMKFHHLRNSFLHDLSEAGATTREAGALAGHRSEKTTERYIGRWSKDKVRSIAHLRKGSVSG